jgi:glycosyltransferase involved in cell wall biosynthesis
MNKMNKMDIMNKKTLCIYAGYTPPYNGSNYKTQNVYGSDMNIIRIGELMANKYNFNVYIWLFGLQQSNMELTYNGVHYIDASKLNNFNKQIDIMIVNRYLNYFIHFKSKAIKTFLYIQDMCPNYMYNGKELSDYGSNVMYNICNNTIINGIICISDWQKQNVLTHFDISSTPIHIIGNGINSPVPSKNLNKIITNRFIYCSDPNRGLSLFLDCIIKLQIHIHDCSIVIFRSSEFDENIRNKLKLIKNKTVYDKVSHDVVIQEFIKADIWFYPTTFLETFCNCAAEAQLYNTICVYNNIGALNTTIGNRGISLNTNESNYIQYAVNNLLKLIYNKELKQKLRYIGYEWASQIIFEKKIEEWYKLLK